MTASKQANGSRARAQRVDSKESAVVAMAHANKVIVPPADFTKNMSEDDREKFTIIFNEIIEEFAKVDWTKHSIRLAAMLARTMKAMQDDFDELDDEGSVIQNDRGNYMMNPRRAACQGYSGMILQMRRSLALHAMAVGGKPSEMGRRKGINKGNEADAPDDDDLLPMPNVA